MNKEVIWAVVYGAIMASLLEKWSVSRREITRTDMEVMTDQAREAADLAISWPEMLKEEELHPCPDAE